MRINSAQSTFDVTSTGEARRPSRKDFLTTLQSSISAHYNLVQRLSGGTLPPSGPSHHNLPSDKMRPQQSFNDRLLELRPYRQEVLALRVIGANIPAEKP